MDANTSGFSLPLATSPFSNSSSSFKRGTAPRSTLTRPRACPYNALSAAVSARRLGRPVVSHRWEGMFEHQMPLEAPIGALQPGLGRRCRSHTARIRVAPRRDASAALVDSQIPSRKHPPEPSSSDTRAVAGVPGDHLQRIFVGVSLQ